MPARGRPRVNPNLHYRDEIRLWAAAERNNGLRYQCQTPGHAINIIYRLNRARAAVRNEIGQGWHAWDVFGVKRDRDNLSAVLIYKKPKLDLSNVQDLEGNLIATPEAEVFLPNRPNPLHDFMPNAPLGLESKDD